MELDRKLCSLRWFELFQNCVVNLQNFSFIIRLGRIELKEAETCTNPLLG